MDQPTFGEKIPNQERHYHGYQAFFGLGLLAYGLFVAVLAGVYSSWSGLVVSSSPQPLTLTRPLESALSFAPFFYFGVSLAACRTKASGMQLRILLASALVLLTFIIVGFGLATLGPKVPWYAFWVGPFTLWSPCILASLCLTSSRWSPESSDPAPRPSL
jgi:hypothetical protein